MAATSQYPAAVRALRDLVGAQTGFRVPGDTAAGPAITVLVGQQALQTKGLGDWVALGWQPPGGDAGRFEQEVAALATTRPRNEKGRIRCLASAQRGNLDPLDTLDAAFAALAGVETALRVTDPQLGLRGPGAGQVQQFHAQLGEAGAVRWDKALQVGHRCEIEFLVTYEARL